MKVYGIAYHRGRPRAELVEAAKIVARERVLPAVEECDHYGAGFIGAHDGRGANFVFVDYWADENELRHPVSSASGAPKTNTKTKTPT